MDQADVLAFSQMNMWYVRLLHENKNDIGK